MRTFLNQIRKLPEDFAASHLAFGDLFLEDIRQYREEKLCGTGFTPIFPVWGQDTSLLARRMVKSGIRAIVTALNPTMIPAKFAGRWFDSNFLAELPEGVDPLGENGEFHTCVVDGPMFSSPIAAKPGRIVERKIAAASNEGDGLDKAENASPAYVYADVVPFA